MTYEPSAAFAAIVTVLRRHRFSLTNEKTTQAEIADALIAAGIPAAREVLWTAPLS